MAGFRGKVEGQINSNLFSREILFLGFGERHPLLSWPSWHVEIQHWHTTFLDFWPRISIPLIHNVILQSYLKPTSRLKAIQSIFQDLFRKHTTLLTCPKSQHFEVDLIRSSLLEIIAYPWTLRDKFERPSSESAVNINIESPLVKDYHPGNVSISHTIAGTFESVMLHPIPWKVGYLSTRSLSSLD